jgi:hypothetical protein
MLTRIAAFSHSEFRGDTLAQSSGPARRAYQFRRGRMESTVCLSPRLSPGRQSPVKALSYFSSGA